MLNRIWRDENRKDKKLTVKNNGNQQNDEFLPNGHTQRHADKHTVEENAHLQQINLHRFLLLFLFRRQPSMVLMSLDIRLDLPVLLLVMRLNLRRRCNTHDFV